MCHVLIIEDDALVAMDIEAILLAEGATSFAFAASERAAVREALARRPTLITSDVKLIEGSGPAAVATIRDKLGTIPVIFISGTPEACRHAAPLCLIFEKPFNPATIAAAFHALAPQR